MEIILHIGTHKTGSTSIQEFLTNNRDILLNYHGILYPIPFPNRNEIHHASIPLSLRSFGNLSYGEILSDLLNQINSTGDKVSKVVISTEEFTPLGPYNIVNLKKFLNDFCISVPIDKVTIVLYLRRQDEYIESSYAEAVRYLLSKSNSTIDDFIIYNLRLLNYYQRIKKMIEIISDFDLEINFKIRLFRKSVDVVGDFSENILNIAPTAKQIRANESFSPETILALRKLNDEFDIPNDIYLKLLEFIWNFDKNRESYMKNLLTYEQRINILRHFEEDNIKFFREFFNSENLFLLSEDEKNFYKQQDEFVKSNWGIIQREIESRFNIFLNELKRYSNEKLAKREFKITFSGYNRIFGFVDEVSLRGIYGWIYNFNTNTAKVTINIEGFDIYEKEADVYREDISEIFGLPESFKTGFRILWEDINFSPELIEHLSSLNCRSIKIVVKEKESGLGIVGNYIELEKETFLNNIIKDIKYHIDRVIDLQNKKVISGWLFNTKKPIKSLTVEKGKAIYGLKREDVKLAHKIVHAEKSGFMIEAEISNRLPIRIIYQDNSEDYVLLKIAIGALSFEEAKSGF